MPVGCKNRAIAGRQIFIATGHLPARCCLTLRRATVLSSDSYRKMSTRLAEESVTLWLAKIVDGVVTYASGEHARGDGEMLRVRGAGGINIKTV